MAGPDQHESERLVFALGNDRDEDDQCTLDKNCIIGIQHVHKTENENRCTLMYVDVAETVDKVSPEERTSFKSLVVRTPEDEVVRTFSPAAMSLWPTAVAQPGHDDAPSLQVIVSMGSGKQHAKKCFEQLVAPFLAAMGFEAYSDYHVYFTESAETITNLTKSVFLPQAKQGTRQSIILLSGDGGVVDILNGLFSSESSLPSTFVAPRVGLVPSGTGNALANSSGVNKDHTLGLSTLFRGSPQSLPVFKVRLSPDSTLLDSYGEPVASNSHVASHLAASSSSDVSIVYGAVVFSYGLHACLVADSDTPEYRKHGAERFQMAAKDLLYPPDGSQPHEYLGRVSVSRRRAVIELTSKTMDDAHRSWEPIPRNTHAYVLATLVSHLEKGFTISPASKPLEGKLRLVHFGPMGEGGKDIMGIMQAAYAGGTHVEDERVGYEEVEGVKIEFGADGAVETEKWRRVCVDGKIFRMGPKGWVMVEMEERRPVELMWLDR